jgi:hypothetical protein
MKKSWPALLFVLLLVAVIVKEHVPGGTRVISGEGCVVCHDKVIDPDPFHPLSAFGCHRCHLGNPYAISTERAHMGMVRNPGDLRVVDRTCGSSACHADVLNRVTNGVMATNAGILRTLQSQWPGLKSTRTEVRSLLGQEKAENLALDYYRKMCAGCHLWKPRHDRPGEAGRRGGGCTDCHVKDETRPSAQKIARGQVFDHPGLTTRIPSDNCIKCHNRSARIGLSYFGRYESEGYGTPYEGADLSSRTLSGNRFYLDLQADVHFSKARMDCIDCHTGVEVMGDGKHHEDMDTQLDITCEACHMPKFSTTEANQTTAERLARLNERVSAPHGEAVALTKKGTPLYNLRQNGERVTFYRKADGGPIQLDTRSVQKPYHRLPGHERISCQTCHSAWMVQCYGCHLTYLPSGRQVDWLTGSASNGRWEEKRVYARFEDPALGIRGGMSQVYPLSPCQVFFSYAGKDEPNGAKPFKLLSVSAFDPHTTAKTSRSCRECHGDLKALGFGSVRADGGEGGDVLHSTEAASRAPSQGPAKDFPLDAFLDSTGVALQTNPYDGTRPFTKSELASIRFVNLCLGCHEDYGDKIYEDFAKSKRRYLSGEKALPCLSEKDG